MPPATSVCPRYGQDRQAPALDSDIGARRGDDVGRVAHRPPRDCVNPSTCADLISTDANNLPASRYRAQSAMMRQVRRERTADRQPLCPGSLANVAQIAEVGLREQDYPAPPLPTVIFPPSGNEPQLNARRAV